MFRLAVASSLLLAVSLPLSAASEMVAAANSGATPANQLVVSGNACGPTALLNAFRFGNDSWQRAASGITGGTDKERIYTIIREIGMRPSAHIKGRPRWSRKGVNIADLCDMANEMTRGQYLPQVSQEVLFRSGKETQEDLLKRIHNRLKTSLEKGLPPVISLRRYVLRKQGDTKGWMVVDAHFVTVTGVPDKLEKGVRSFAVSYVDPWGGKKCEGKIGLSERGILAENAVGSPCAEAVFPQASIGKKLIKEGEVSGLVVAAVMGRW